MTGVYVATKTDSSGTLSPAALGTAYTVYSVGADSQADDFLLEGYLDLRNMASGDTVQLLEYVNVLGNALEPFQENTYSGAQTLPVIRFYSKTLAKAGGYSVTLNQTAGTLRTYDWAFILQVLSG
ncbi:MAG TPA: hypothetical protein VMG99_09055 [Thermoplasmata archaeon]|nr:hypothetical protein [Thermoplasmata archaeon]